MLFAGFPQFAK